MMTRLAPGVATADETLTAALARIPESVGLSRDYPADALAEAQDAAAHPVLPERDATDIEFVTLDPAGSMDLDQALFLERDGSGYRFCYAIADLPSFIRPGGALDAEARKRGETVYAPDGRIPLHPPVISEGAASLLPDHVRSAFVWEFGCDANGAVTSTALSRGRVRSRAQLDYASVQQQIDAGTASGSIALLQEFGEARSAIELARGGASLNTPEVDIEADDGGYRLVRRRVLPVENWNAQLSLLTGMEAAKIMLAGKVGVLRTMPQPPDWAFERFRRQTEALGAPWPHGQRYGAYLKGLDGSTPAHLAVMHAATSLFRGAGYTAFDGETPTNTLQSAVGAPYAHVTAPLRRLVDRYALEACVALAAGTPVPQWVRDALPTLPELMAHADNIAGQVDNRATDTVEAAVLRTHVGEVFDAVVLAPDRVQLTEPAVEARCDGADQAGVAIRATLVQADVASGSVRFSVA